MADWRSYDHVAGRYDEVWGSRFEEVARQIWARVTPAPGTLVLDVGTGTGIVPRTLGDRAKSLGGVVGCDRSARMLSSARAAMPPLRVLAADATALPFGHSIFDLVTASFVMSHLRNPGAGLREAYRVLKPAGAFVMTSWTANTDPFSQAWSGLLAEEVSKDSLQNAVAQVAPSEARFEHAEDVEATLVEAGFVRREVHAVALDISLSLEEFLADRELSSGGRFARDALGPEGWRQFAAHASEALRRSFGARLVYSRGVLIGVAHRG